MPRAWFANAVVMSVIVIVILTCGAARAAELPKVELKLVAPGDRLDGASRTSFALRPNERIDLRARVMGGRRAWCMNPERYTPKGRHTTFLRKGLDGCAYEVDSGTFQDVGTWSVKSEKYEWSASGGVIEPKGNGEYATFTAPTQTGSVTITVTGTVEWYLDSRVKRDVKDGPVTATATVEVAGGPAGLMTEEAKRRILERFMSRIPAGPARHEALSHIGPPGFANNVWSLLDPFVPGVDWSGYHEFSCGGYQGRVLQMLDEMRLSSNPDESAIFELFDYGPVQAYHGGHQAVVIYPKGTDWEETGLVLDPWPNQQAETFEIDEWKERFPFGVGPSGVYAGHYPIGGGDYPDRMVEVTPTEVFDAFRMLPPDEQARLRAMSQEQRVEHLRNLARERKARVGVVAHSPVKLLVVAKDGRRVGFLPDGRFVYEIEGTDCDFPPEKDGTRGAAFFLPYGQYDVEIRGEARGTFGLTIATPGFAPGERLVTWRDVATGRGATTKLRLDPTSATRPALVDANGANVAATPIAIAGAPAAPPSATSGTSSTSAPSALALGAMHGEAPPATTTGARDEGGKKGSCGCRAAGDRSAGGWLAALPFALVVARLRRRRSTPG